MSEADDSVTGSKIISVYCRDSSRQWHKGGKRRYWLGAFAKLGSEWRSVPFGVRKTYSPLAAGRFEELIGEAVDDWLNAEELFPRPGVPYQSTEDARMRLKDTAAHNWPPDESYGIAPWSKFTPDAIVEVGYGAPGTPGVHGAFEVLGERQEGHILAPVVAWRMMPCPCGYQIPEISVDAATPVLDKLLYNDPPVTRILIDALLRVAGS